VQETGGNSAISIRWSPRWNEAAQALLRRRRERPANEAAHVAARQKLEASRAPLAEAEKRVQRLETEAKTISKLLNGETKNLWPPIIDGVNVARGYEKALGAALGDDLDAPVDPSAPMRWTSGPIMRRSRRCPRR
jgi:chromosome segregation protein